LNELLRYSLESEALDLASGTLRVISASKGELPVIFLHGAHREYQHAKIWLRYVTAFPSTVQPFLIDLPGHGESPVSATGKNFRKNHISILRDFIDESAFSSFVIVGRSYGGRLAMKLASLYPDEIKGLFLIAPAGAEKAMAYLGNLKIPVQIFWAEDDPMIPVSNIKYFYDLGDNIQSYILPSAGIERNAHCPEELVPEIFLKLFNNLIDRITDDLSLNTFNYP